MLEVLKDVIHALMMLGVRKQSEGFEAIGKARGTGGVFTHSDTIRGRYPASHMIWHVDSSLRPVKERQLQNLEDWWTLSLIWRRGSIDNPYRHNGSGSMVRQRRD